MDELVYGLKLIDRIKETKDSATLIFEVGEELVEQFEFVSGQFVTLHLMIEGQLIKRSYSLSSAPSENTFNITIKKIEGGKASGFLVEQLEVGKIVPMTPPAGIFTYTPKKINSSDITLIAAGSGITPLYSIIKSALIDEKNIHLIYCNRCEENVIFKDELKKLSDQHTNLKVTYILSQPKVAWGGLTGRANSETLSSLFKEGNLTKTNYFMCGPVALMDMATETLLNLGVDKKAIHKEDFNPAVYANTSEDVNSETVYIGDMSTKSDPGKQLTVVLNDETFDIVIDPEKTILENLIEQDKNPPYSCMDGACMACLAKITDGLVKQDDPGILTEESIEDREVLTCKAKIASAKATLNYDDLF